MSQATETPITARRGFCAAFSVFLSTSSKGALAILEIAEARILGAGSSVIVRDEATAAEAQS